MSGIVFLLLASTLLLAQPQAAFAEDAYAATVEVTYPGVQIKRANTEVWISLSQGAVAPFGPGDQLRTDTEGRAIISPFAEVELFVLPQSLYALDALTIEDGVLTQFEGKLLGGTAIHTVGADTAAMSYTLDVGSVTITSPARSFATRMTPEQTQSVVVAEGTLELSYVGESFAVALNSGAFVANDTLRMTRFAPPLNAARLEAVLDGCRGMVETSQAVPLRVRQGPGVGFVVTGDLNVERPIQLMAINESRGWYRIQYLSSFGWVLASAVETACQNLPVLPDTTAENLIQVPHVNAREQAILQPYFGTARDDPWFYRSN